VNLVYPIGHYTVTGGGALEYAYTPNERSDKKSVVNNVVDANLQSTGALFRPTVRYERLSTYARSEIELGKKSQRNAQTVYAGLGWTPVPGGRLSINVGYNDLRTRFAADEFFRDVSLAQKLNFNFRTPSAEAVYELTPLLSVTGLFEFTDNDFILAPDRNSSMYRTMGGVTFVAPGSLVGSARAGFRSHQNDSVPDLTVHTLTVDSMVTYTRPTALVAAQYYRDVGFSWDDSKRLFVSDQVTGRYYRQLPKRLDFEVGAQLIWISYVEREVVPGFEFKPRGQYRNTYLGAFGVRLTRWTRVGINLERDASYGNEQWSSWRFVSYLYYGSFRFRRLDRPLPR
jgi:hypothetical protein